MPRASSLDTRTVRRHLTPVSETTVSTKGQIVLPAELRERDEIAPGQVFRVERLKRGEYRLVRRRSAPNEGLVAWLRRCPEENWFVPVESESTDDLTPLS